MDTTLISETILCIKCNQKFEKELIVLINSEHLVSEANAECPRCYEMNYFDVNGKIATTQTFYRGNNND